jgi:hypothetical protein
MPSNNILLTTKTFAKLVLFDLGNMLNVAKNMSRSIDPEFGKPSYKIGDTVQVRKPYRFVGGDGIGWDPEPLVDQVTPVSVTNMPHVHFQWDSREKTLDLREAMKLYTTPVAIAMASRVNGAAATFAANNALNSVGTPGTAPADETSYLTAGDILVELGLPQNEATTLIINRRMSSKFVSGTKGLFNPQGLIGTQWEDGQIGKRQLGTRILLDQTINTRTNGTFSGSVVVSGAQQADGGNNATMTLTISGLTGTLKQGDRLIIGSSTSATVGGVNSVYPQGLRPSTGRQQTFTIQQDTGANPTSIVVAPAITPSGQYQNTDSAASDQAIITFIGTTGLTGIQQGLMLHENAFAFVCVPINEPDAGMGAKVSQFTDDDTGLVISHVAYFDGDNGIEKHKFQALTGYGNMYREMACVIQA